MQYADFWKRTAAYLVDYVIYEILCIIVGVGLVLCLKLTGGDPSAIIFNLLLIFASIVVYLLYYVWPESSTHQATWGKRLFRLKVTDENGQRISFWRSLGRHLGMAVSSFILCIGYLMCIWTQRRQCLHDYMASCLVTDETPQEKQGCAVAVIITFVISCFIVPFIVGVLAAIALPQYTMAVERSRAAEAVVLLKHVRDEQRQFLEDNRHYAARWQDFELPIVNDQTFCLTPDQTCEPHHKYQVFLDKQGVTALRINTQSPYQLTLPYAAGESVQCSSEKDSYRWLRL